MRSHATAPDAQLAGTDLLLVRAIQHGKSDDVEVTVRGLVRLTGLSRRTVSRTIPRLSRADIRAPAPRSILPYMARAAWNFAAAHGSAKAVLVTLASRADHFGECWLSVATIAKRIGRSERTVQRGMVELLRLGVLVREWHGRPSLTTKLNLALLLDADAHINDAACARHALEPVRASSGDRMSPNVRVGLPRVASRRSGAASAVSLRSFWRGFLRSERGWARRIGILRQFARSGGWEIAPARLGWAARQFRSGGDDGCQLLMGFLAGHPDFLSTRTDRAGIERILGAAQREGRIERRQCHPSGMPASVLEPVPESNPRAAVAGLDGPIAEACRRAARLAADARAARGPPRQTESATAGGAAEIAEVVVRLAAAEAGYGPGDPTLLRRRIARLRGEPEAPSDRPVGPAVRTHVERDIRRTRDGHERSLGDLLQDLDGPIAERMRQGTPA